MAEPSCIPRVGEIVRVRQRAYLVEEVDAPSQKDRPTLCKLSCVDDDAQGQPLEVLWEYELDGSVIGVDHWEKLGTRGFDQPDIFAAYLNTLRWNCITATDPRLFQAPFRAGIRIEPYQLEPLRKALLLPRVNLFIADDVGVGKTIESGLIARELLLRKKARDIVVCCPPSMILQWKEEMEARFGLIFEVLDRAYLARVRRERGFAVNPWTTHSRFLFSHRLLIDEGYTAGLRDWLGELRPGSLLIFDEAHHAAPSSGSRYAIDTKITRAMRDLAPRFEHRLFLSATPHNGHSNSFSALLEILDPQRFCRGVKVRKGDLDAVMVRRLKEDIREVAGGFSKRQVVQLDLDGLSPESPELRLPDLLDEYRRTRELRLESDSRRSRSTSALLLTGLQQRLLSSIEAFARTLRVHRLTVQRHWEQWQSQTAGLPQSSSATAGGAPDPEGLWLDPVTADDDRAELPEDLLGQQEEAAIARASRDSAGTLESAESQRLFAREQQLLEQMAAMADAARSNPDARIRRLLQWMNDHMCPGLTGAPAHRNRAVWNDLRIIIFTEFDDTKRYIERQLRSAIENTDFAEERIAIFHGPTPSDERERIKRAFNSDPATNPLRILIATDAAREGLNLQSQCWNLFHFDVPWNPARMEQRNGRIDRKLQPRPEVFCHYFFYRQRPEDRILQVLVKKSVTIREELGSFSSVLEEQLAGALKSGIRRDQLEQTLQQIQSADLQPELKQSISEELEETRFRQDALRQQIAALAKCLEDSRQRINFNEQHFQAAVSCGLNLAGAPALKPITGHRGRLEFPALDLLPGADPTWASAIDSLRRQRSAGQSIFEWRKLNPPRPVVFEDPGDMSERTVQFHLEQRVVQRLLGRFRAQGFVHHDLSRCCLTHTADRVPRVILLGRLCLYGSAAARLHEELIFVAARWSDPARRSEPLAPYARDAEGFSLHLLNTALEGPDAPHAERAAVLRQSVTVDVNDLLPHLQERGENYAIEAQQALQKRGTAEAAAMRRLLEDQQKRIQQTAQSFQSGRSQQLAMAFGEAERRQLDADRRYWNKRLESLTREIREQPERISALYRIHARRIEPVGLVYLWPRGD
ncbi:MAG: DISARM system SNF2-like helicase DrmD [Phycisphaerae bacterium]